MAEPVSTDSFEYLDPFSAPAAAPDPYLPRLSIAGAPRIAFLSNMFTDASAFLKDLEGPLSRIVPNASFLFFDKAHRRNSSYPVAPERIAEIADQCDAVITAFGHCGSCTAGTVRDTVAFARAGVPVVALVTQKFMEEAAFVSRAAGIPDVPFVFLPHPVAGRDLPFQRALGEAIAPAILRALTRGETVHAMTILEEREAQPVAA